MYIQSNQRFTLLSDRIALLSDDTVGAEGLIAQRVARSIPARNKHLYVLQIVVPGLTVCVCEFSMFANALTIQELFPGRAKFTLKKKKMFWRA